MTSRPACRSSDRAEAPNTATEDCRRDGPGRHVRQSHRLGPGRGSLRPAELVNEGADPLQIREARSRVSAAAAAGTSSRPTLRAPPPRPGTAGSLPRPRAHTAPSGRGSARSTPQAAWQEGRGRPRARCSDSHARRGAGRSAVPACSVYGRSGPAAMERTAVRVDQPVWAYRCASGPVRPSCSARAASRRFRQDPTVGLRLSRARRSRSVIPPQMPCSIRESRAWARHSVRTGHPAHTILARFCPAPSVNSSSGSALRHAPRRVQSVSSTTLSPSSPLSRPRSPPYAPPGTRQYGPSKHSDRPLSCL